MAGHTTCQPELFPLWRISRRRYKVSMLRLQKFQFPRNSVPEELEMSVYFSGFQGYFIKESQHILRGKIRHTHHFFVEKQKG